MVLHSIRHHHSAKPSAVHHSHIFFVYSLLAPHKKRLLFFSYGTCDAKNMKTAAAMHMSSIFSSTFLEAPHNVFTSLKVPNECGQNETKLKHLENICVLSDVCGQQSHLCFCSVCSVHVLFLFCFWLCSCFVCSVSVLFLFCFCSVPVCFLSSLFLFSFDSVFFLFCFVSVVSLLFLFCFWPCSCFV
jgi:hypothetical protein